MFIKTISILLIISFTAIHAANLDTKTDKFKGEKIDVEGIVNKNLEKDTELEHFQTELKKIEFQNKNNKKKINILKKLGSQMDQLSSSHEEYFRERLEWEDKVNQFNKKIDCLEKKGAGCEALGGISSVNPQARYEQAVSQKINRNINSLKYCYQRELKQGERISGTINTVLEINKKGQLEHTHIINEDKGVENIRRCIVHVLHKMTFPPTPDQKTFKGITSINLL